MDSPFEMGDRLYSTGDIACWTAAGDIMLAGRVDRQVKLRGLRVEPQEVASCLASHPGVREAAARVFEQNGQVILVGYYTADTAIPEAELLSYAASYLPRYMVPASILRLDSLPLSPSGKINESLLPPPESNTGMTGLPASELQNKLLAIFREVLHRDQMGVADDYFQSGGDSLNAMEAIGLVSERLGLSLRIADLYACRNVLRLAELLGDDTPRAENAVRLTPAPALERYPLTPIQQGIFVQSLMDPGGLTYNMAGAFRLGITPDIPRLQAAFERVIAGDRLFRARFVQEPDGVYLKLASSVPFELPVLSGDSLEEVGKTFVRPFDLSCSPLLRAALWQEPKGSWILMLDMHHSIGDGLSTPVLLRRLDEAYRGAEQGAGSLDYLDYAYDLTARAKENAEGRLDYWVQNLDRKSVV
jgi:surfactin family lipopeptide synthetase A